MSHWPMPTARLTMSCRWARSGACSWRRKNLAATVRMADRRIGEVPRRKSSEYTTALVRFLLTPLTIRVQGRNHGVNVLHVSGVRTALSALAHKPTKVLASCTVTRRCKTITSAVPPTRSYLDPPTSPRPALHAFSCAPGQSCGHAPLVEVLGRGTREYQFFCPPNEQQAANTEADWTWATCLESRNVCSIPT